jgi:hypothetical protein
MFQNAQDFYQHLGDCVLHIVQQEDPSKAINVKQLAEVENDPAVYDTLQNNGFATATMDYYSMDEEDDEELSLGARIGQRLS